MWDMRYDEYFDFAKVKGKLYTGTDKPRDVDTTDQLMNLKRQNRDDSTNKFLINVNNKNLEDVKKKEVDIKNKKETNPQVNRSSSKLLNTPKSDSDHRLINSGK